MDTHHMCFTVNSNVSASKDHVLERKKAVTRSKQNTSPHEPQRNGKNTIIFKALQKANDDCRTAAYDEARSNERFFMPSPDHRLRCFRACTHGIVGSYGRPHAGPTRVCV
jgi:hypothetical protein